MENLFRTRIKTAMLIRKVMKRFLLAISLTTLAPVATDAQVTNLRLAGASLPTVNGNLVAFLVSESFQGADLNGDGDTDDDVVHVYNATTGITTNLALASSGNLEVSGNLVAFVVRESAQGNTDLNGDGDTNDNFVVHVYHATTGITTNLALASNSSQALVSGNLVAFLVSEPAQGNTNLNGDTDTNDDVVHVYNATTGITTNLGLASAGSPEVSGNLVAFLVSEPAQGNTHLNGDTDTNDNVVHVYDATTGITTNLGLQSSFFPRVSGNLVAFVVNESAQGNTDLNGDGDATDVVIHVVRTNTDTDTDGIPDYRDNCPTVANPLQTDANGDGFGDACVDATVPSGANFGSNPIIGSGSKINSGVSVGDDAVIGKKVTLGQGVTAGDDLSIGDGSTINQNASFGDNVTLGTNVTIGKDVVIGSGVTIGNNTVIGQGSHIGNNAQIGAKVTLNRNVTVAANAVIPNGAVIKANSVVP